MGPLSRQVGLAVDQVLEIHGVWGDGSPFAMSRADDAGSLEWRGLCGAAPFLGVVSALRMATHPLLPLWVKQCVVSPDQLPELMLQAQASNASTSLQWHWESADAVQLLRSHHALLHPQRQERLGGHAQRAHHPQKRGCTAEASPLQRCLLYTSPSPRDRG